MFDYHKDKQRYFDMQYLTARDFIIPFIESKRTIQKQDRVLEIGCAEAGVLKAFIEKELTCYGIDLSPSRIEAAKHFQQEAFGLGKLKFLSKNIYDIQLKYDLDGPFDIILLKDVIEHIPKQENFIQQLASFLNPGGVIFLVSHPGKCLLAGTSKWPSQNC